MCFETSPATTTARVEGIFEVSAPIVVSTADGVLFDSASPGRDVVFTDRLKGDPSDPRLTHVELGVDFHHLSPDPESPGQTPRRRQETPGSAARDDESVVRSVHARQVRVRTVDVGRYVVDVLDETDGSVVSADCTFTRHLEYDLTGR